MGILTVGSSVDFNFDIFSIDLRIMSQVVKKFSESWSGERDVASCSSKVIIVYDKGNYMIS